MVPVAGRQCPLTGKVTVGLALEWPCVTCLSHLWTHDLSKEDTTPPTLRMDYGTFLFIVASQYKIELPWMNPHNGSLYLSLKLKSETLILDQKSGLRPN